eukprot:688822-Prymnesium_polylepis.2
MLTRSCFSLARWTLMYACSALSFPELSRCRPCLSAMNHCTCSPPNRRACGSFLIARMCSSGRITSTFISPLLPHGATKTVQSDKQPWTTPHTTSISSLFSLTRNAAYVRDSTPSECSSRRREARPPTA